MGLLTSLFGQKGVIRFEGYDFQGKKYSGKTPIEVFGHTNEEIEEELKNYIFVEKGIRLVTLKIVGFYNS